MKKKKNLKKTTKVPNKQARKRVSSPKTKYKHQKKTPENQVLKPTNSRNGIFLLLILTVILYANTLGHDYALDDTIVIVENTYVQEGFAGIGKILKSDSFEGYFHEQVNYVVGGRYRPLSLITYAIEYELFGAAPAVGHLFNILYYALTGIVLFLLFQYFLLTDQGQRFKQKNAWYSAFPLVLAAIFIAHPIHTEAVANIKGRDEILALLLSLLSLLFCVRYAQKQQIKQLLLAAGSFFLALLSKENSITFLAVIPLSIFFFVSKNKKSLINTSWPLLLTSLVFLVIRYQVIGGTASEAIPELMNDPFLLASPPEKYATIVYTMGYYLRLLIFPHPLTYDYYPFHIAYQSWTNILVIASFLAYIGLLILVIRGWKRQSITAYGILFYVITISIVSNLLFPVGSFMNERFLFMPSIGFCIILAYLLTERLPAVLKNTRWQTILKGITILIIGLYGYKTITRNQVWANNFTLFTHDIEISSQSAKGNTIVGETYLKESLKDENAAKKEQYLSYAKKYLKQALRIHPRYEGAMLLLGDTYKTLAQYDSALVHYQNVLTFKKYSYDAYFKIGTIYGKYLKEPGKSLPYFEQALKIKPNKMEVNYSLGTMYIQTKQIDKAIVCLQQAIKLRPDYADAYKNMGGAYYYKKDHTQAVRFFEQALRLDPNDKGTIQNLVYTYEALGNKAKAQQYRQKLK